MESEQVKRSADYFNNYSSNKQRKRSQMKSLEKRRTRGNYHYYVEEEIMSLKMLLPKVITCFLLTLQVVGALMNLPDGIENILGFVPRSTFRCERDGYFGDIDNDCRIFHLCQRQISSNGRTEWRHWTYACGNQTMFNQLTLTCAFVDEAIPCRHATQFQYLNEVIHKPREPFLTDADVTSGVSYYSNRVMSDGARTRAFEDSRLMAQLGGSSGGSGSGSGQQFAAERSSSSNFNNNNQFESAEASEDSSSSSRAFNSLDESNSFNNVEQNFALQRQQQPQQVPQVPQAPQVIINSQHHFQHSPEPQQVFNQQPRQQVFISQNQQFQQPSFNQQQVFATAAAAPPPPQLPQIAASEQPNEQQQQQQQQPQQQQQQLLQRQNQLPELSRQSFPEQQQQQQTAFNAPQPQQQQPANNLFDFSISTNHQLGNSGSDSSVVLSNQFVTPTSQQPLVGPLTTTERQQLAPTTTSLPVVPVTFLPQQQQQQETSTLPLRKLDLTSPVTTTQRTQLPPVTTTTTSTTTSSTTTSTAGSSSTTIRSAPQQQQQLRRRSSQVVPTSGRQQQISSGGNSNNRQAELFDHQLHRPFQSTRLSSNSAAQQQRNGELAPALVMRRSPATPASVAATGSEGRTGGAVSANFEEATSNFWRLPWESHFASPARFESMLTRRRV